MHSRQKTGMLHIKSNTDNNVFLRINVTEKNFCNMGNRTHDLGTNRLAHRSRTLYHCTKSLSKKTKFIGVWYLTPPMCTFHELMILINRGTIIDNHKHVL